MTRTPCIHTHSVRPAASGLLVSFPLTQSCSGFTLAHPRLTHFLSIPSHSPPTPIHKNLNPHPAHTVSALIYMHVKFNITKMKLLKCNDLKSFSNYFKLVYIFKAANVAFTGSDCWKLKLRHSRITFDRITSKASEDTCSFRDSSYKHWILH